jgi:hypothetical protein
MYQGQLSATTGERPVDPEDPTATAGERPVDPQVPTFVKTLATAAGPILELSLPAATIEQLKHDDGTLTVRLVSHE